MSTNDLVWATARVRLQMLEITNPEERIEDHWPYSDSETIGGQKPGQKGAMRGVVPNVCPRRAPRSLMIIWIKLNCRRPSNFGLVMTFVSTEHLLAYAVLRKMETSLSDISLICTLRTALRTGYKRLSTIIKGQRAIGEVSEEGIFWDDRGPVVPITNYRARRKEVGDKCSPLKHSEDGIEQRTPPIREEVKGITATLKVINWNQARRTGVGKGSRNQPQT